MSSKFFTILFPIVVFVGTTYCNRQFYGPMKDFNKCLSTVSVNPKLSKDHCFSHLCSFVPALFECKVLQCKKKFPGRSEAKKKSLVRCVKGVCATKSSQSLCQGIRKCEELRKGLPVETELEACIANLFPEK